MEINGCDISNLDFYAKQSQNKRVYVTILGGLYTTLKIPQDQMQLLIHKLKDLHLLEPTEQHLYHIKHHHYSLASVFCDKCIFRTINADGSFTSYNILY